MDYKETIEKYLPTVDQEKSDRNIILNYIKDYECNILTRENQVAHITSSGLILNKNLDKILMVHHNIYQTWAWTGGHADGNADLLEVAIKEGKEETGLENLIPLSIEPLAIDILPVLGHIKKGNYVSAHLHLNVTYVLIADELERLKIKEDENSGVKWILVSELEQFSNEPFMIEVYLKIVEKARRLSNYNHG
ncbi:NUDIX hydrolase [Fusibacter bizertensis]